MNGFHDQAPVLGESIASGGAVLVFSWPYFWIRRERGVSPPRGVPAERVPNRRYSSCGEGCRL